jgi:hypothetical protein
MPGNPSRYSVPIFKSSVAGITRSPPLSRIATQFPDDLIPRIVNDELRGAYLNLRAASSDDIEMDILIVGLVIAAGLYIAVRLTLRYFFPSDT